MNVRESVAFRLIPVMVSEKCDGRKWSGTTRAFIYTGGCQRGAWKPVHQAMIKELVTLHIRNEEASTSMD